MSVVKPFKGLRPESNIAHEVASPPYDVLSSDEARAMVQKHPNSFLRVNKPEVDLPPDANHYSQKVYQRGRDNLLRMISEKIMRRDETDCYYLYRLTWQDKSQTGLVALASVAEYDAGLIKKHEHTRPEKVNDRTDHIMTLNAQVGPVFSTFHQNDSIRNEFVRLTEKAPDVDFVADNDVRHQLWVISNVSDQEELTASFASLSALYIADGHHRSEAASEACRRLESESGKLSDDAPGRYFLNVIFPDDELRILPYNRVVSDLNGLSVQKLLEMAEDKFTVQISESEVTPNSDGQFGFYCAGKWYLLTAREGTIDSTNPSASIDSAVLTANFLDPILGIRDLRTDTRINFIGGIRGNTELVRLVDSGRYQAAFSLNAVTVAQLLAVADAGQVMPPKSTWFEPKLRSGMVVNLLD